MGNQVSDSLFNGTRKLYKQLKNCIILAQVGGLSFQHANNVL